MLEHIYDYICKTNQRSLAHGSSQALLGAQLSLMILDDLFCHDLLLLTKVLVHNNCRLLRRRHGARFSNYT